MFGSNKNNNIPQNSAPTSGEDVYVMPEKFHSQKSQQSSNKVLVIVIIILLLVAISSGSYFMYDMWQKNKAATEQANTNTQVVNTNLNENTNEVRNINVNENLNGSENVNATSTENLNTNENVNANENVNGNINQLAPPVSSGDADKDQLTDLEEALIGTSPSSPDSDLDGYLDSEELIGGYNPAVNPSSGKPFRLDSASFISQLSTNFPVNNFQTIYIKGWSVSLIEALHEARIITGTGEMVKISVINNDDQISAANWYLLNHPQIALSQLSNLEFGNFKGIRSPNGLAVYLTSQKRDKIYAFEYDLDTMAEFRYPSIFEMIIRNFKLIDTPVIETGNNNTNTNSSENTESSL